MGLYADDLVPPPDTRANQPAANSVPTGALYCVSDEGNIVERSNGTTWDPYSPVAGAGTVTTTGSPANGNLTKFSSATSITNGDLTGAVTTSGGLATTLATGLSPDFASISLAGNKFQNFGVQVINSAGTLQHRIFGSQDFAANYVASAYADKITGASVTLANTPTVGVGTDFTNGVGKNATNALIFNTAAQDNTEFLMWCAVEYYDGNSSRPRALCGMLSANVNGNTRVRPYIWLTNDLDGTAWNIDTTRLPSGKSIFVRVSGFLV